MENEVTNKTEMETNVNLEIKDEQNAEEMQCEGTLHLKHIEEINDEPSVDENIYNENCPRKEALVENIKSSQQPMNMQSQMFPFEVESEDSKFAGKSDVTNCHLYPPSTEVLGEDVTMDQGIGESEGTELKQKDIVMQNRDVNIHECLQSSKMKDEFTEGDSNVRTNEELLTCSEITASVKNVERKDEGDVMQIQVNHDINIHEGLQYSNSNIKQTFSGVNLDMVTNEVLTSSATTDSAQPLNEDDIGISTCSNHSNEPSEKPKKIVMAEETETVLKTFGLTDTDQTSKMEVKSKQVNTDLSKLKESLAEIVTNTGANTSLVVYSSSDEETDSDSEDDSTTSTSTSDSESNSEVLKLTQNKNQTEAMDRDDKSIPQPPKTKKELMLQDLPAVPYIEFRLGGNEEILLLGKISSIIGQLAVVQSNKDTPALNEDTVLFNEGRHPIGAVFEIFGPVASPFYTVRFNSTKDITDFGLALNANIYFAPKQEEITNYVFVKQLTAMKGSDASWANDEEPPVECLDYSDDEEERNIKKKKGLEAGKRKAAKRREEGNCTETQSQGNMNSRDTTMHSNQRNQYQKQNFNYHQRGPSQGPYNRPPRIPFHARGSGPAIPRPPHFQRPMMNPRGHHNQTYQPPDLAFNQGPPNFVPYPDLHGMNPAQGYNTPPPRNMHHNHHGRGGYHAPFYTSISPYAAQPPRFILPGMPAPGPNTPHPDTMGMPPTPPN